MLLAVGQPCFGIKPISLAASLIVGLAINGAILMVLEISLDIL